MSARLPVTKTYKLFINGGFPRTESGRSLAIEDRRGQVVAHICRGSRKDMRDAVEAARGAQESWASRSAYNRGQILYRMAEMMEGKRDEFAQAINVTAPSGATIAQARREVDDAIDRLVTFAGWTDKFAQVLGGRNPVVGPYYNFTAPEPTGVIAAVVPDVPPLLALITLSAPALSAGNTLVVISGTAHPLPAVLLGEVCATSDLPGGVMNILTADRDELIEHIAQHRNIDAIAGANLGAKATTILERGAAENLKRVRIEKWSKSDWSDPKRGGSPWRIEPFVEMKTIWHPSAC